MIQSARENRVKLADGPLKLTALAKDSDPLPHDPLNTFSNGRRDIVARSPVSCSCPRLGALYQRF